MSNTKILVLFIKVIISLLKIYLITFKKKNIKSFIQVGSSAEYGNLKAPHLESKLNYAQGNYGRAKLKSTKFLLEKNHFQPLF